MCPSIALLGDIGTDHEGFHPSPVIAASPDVFLDGKPVARQGDPLAPHDKPNNPPHPRSISGGVGSVLVNGKPAKASYTVKLGDIIEVTFGNRPVKIRVLSDVEQKGKDVAREMFEIIEE